MGGACGRNFKRDSKLNLYASVSWKNVVIIKILHYNFLMKKTPLGISLLEILMVLAIATVIISTAVDFYVQSTQSTKVSAAANLIEQINKAGHEWLKIPNANGVYPRDFSGLNTAPDGNGLSLFIDKDLIPCANQSCLTNPWGGQTTVISDSNSQYMLVQMTNVSKKACALLREQLKQTAPDMPGQQNACIGNDKPTYQIYL